MTTASSTNTSCWHWSHTTGAAGGATITASNINSIVTERHSGIDISGSLILNGSDIGYRISNIERVLGIPEPDSKLFKKYPKLKDKYEDYINELSKARTWETLKGDDK